MPSRQRLAAWGEERGARFLANASETTIKRLAGKPVVVEGQVLDPVMKVILRSLKQGGHKDWKTLGPADARLQVKHEARASKALPLTPVASTHDTDIAGADGRRFPARVYKPLGLIEEPAPALHYIHGGGFILGDIESHDEVCRVLAARAGVVVISTEYSLAPEAPFPAAVEDTFFAFHEIIERADEFGIDPKRVAVGGDSAGGNLSAVISLMCREAGGPRPAMQLLIYPGVDFHDTERWKSRTTFEYGFFLVRGDMEAAEEYYAVDDPTDPRASPYCATSHDDLPPAYLVTAGYDPLRDEGEAYAAKLIESGTPCAVRRNPGLIHGFANMTQISRTAAVAMAEAAGALRQGLAVKR